MKNENLHLAGAALYDLRKRAVTMKRKGHTLKNVSEAFGVGISTVNKWMKLYREGGNSALHPSKRGRKEGEKRRLSDEQENEVLRLIAEKTPDQIKLPFALWTRRAVMELVRRRYGFLLPIRTVGDYLQRWNYTPQKPLKRAYEQNQQAVQRWLTEEYPAIRERAKAENAEIHWGDESGLRSDETHGRSYAPGGKTPVVTLNARRWSQGILSTVTNQGKLRFMCLDGPLDAKMVLSFFERLVKDAGRKVFLILDNLRVHHAKIVQAWLAEHTHDIEVFYLPSYSPELNPDEILNRDLKAGVYSGEPARSESHLKSKIISHLRMLQKRPERVRKYFLHHSVNYAA